MARGRVKWFNEKKGFGFIVDPEVGSDIFVHFSVIQSDGFKTLNEGDEVEYELFNDEKGAKGARGGEDYRVNPSGARPNILLIGFMGSGKSSIGRLIASRIGYRFADTDQLVVEQTGSQIAELFAQKGEEHFRDEERRALKSLHGSEGFVIATGGGIVTREENLKLLQDLGFVIWLTASEEVIFERVSRNTRRPLVQTADPRRTIHEMLERRTPWYEKAAQFTVDTSKRNHAEIADVILAEVEKLR